MSCVISNDKMFWQIGHGHNGQGDMGSGCCVKPTRMQRVDGYNRFRLRCLHDGKAIQHVQQRKAWTKNKQADRVDVSHGEDECVSHFKSTNVHSHAENEPEATRTINGYTPNVQKVESPCWDWPRSVVNWTTTQQCESGALGQKYMPCTTD